MTVCVPWVVLKAGEGVKARMGQEGVNRHASVRLTQAEKQLQPGER